MDQSEGPSIAAQCAQNPCDEEPEPRSFWKRLFSKSNRAPVQNQAKAEPKNGHDAGNGHNTAPTHGMANLFRLRVSDVFIPKADIVAVPDTVGRDELIKVFRESGYTRLPVYNGNLDTPVGLVHLKDVALRHGFHCAEEDFSIDALLRPLLFVPPSMPIGILLTKMQTDRRHMALVIDEYGGVDGLLTIEDLIEQVIGQIEDEHDAVEGKYWTRKKDGRYIVLAKTPLEEFEAELKLDLGANDLIDREEIDTLGGVVFMLAGRVPARGEVLLHPAGIEFEVLDADPRRIKRLRVCPAPISTAAE